MSPRVSYTTQHPGVKHPGIIQLPTLSKRTADREGKDMPVAVVKKLQKNVNTIASPFSPETQKHLANKKSRNTRIQFSDQVQFAKPDESSPHSIGGVSTQIPSFTSCPDSPVNSLSYSSPARSSYYGGNNNSAASSPLNSFPAASPGNSRVSYTANSSPNNSVPAGSPVSRSSWNLYYSPATPTTPAAAWPSPTKSIPADFDSSIKSRNSSPKTDFDFTPNPETTTPKAQTHEVVERIEYCRPSAVFKRRETFYRNLTNSDATNGAPSSFNRHDSSKSKNNTRCHVDAASWWEKGEKKKTTMALTPQNPLISNRNRPFSSSRKNLLCGKCNKVLIREYQADGNSQFSTPGYQIESKPIRTKCTSCEKCVQLVCETCHNQSLFDGLGLELNCRECAGRHFSGWTDEIATCDYPQFCVKRQFRLALNSFGKNEVFDGLVSAENENNSETRKAYNLFRKKRKQQKAAINFTTALDLFRAKTPTSSQGRKRPKNHKKTKVLQYPGKDFNSPRKDYLFTNQISWLHSDETGKVRPSSAHPLTRFPKDFKKCNFIADRDAMKRVQLEEDEKKQKKASAERSSERPGTTETTSTTKSRKSTKKSVVTKKQPIKRVINNTTDWQILSKTGIIDDCFEILRKEVILEDVLPKANVEDGRFD